MSIGTLPRVQGQPRAQQACWHAQRDRAWPLRRMSVPIRLECNIRARASVQNYHTSLSPLATSVNPRQPQTIQLPLSLHPFAALHGPESQLSTVPKHEQDDFRVWTDWPVCCCAKSTLQDLIRHTFVGKSPVDICMAHCVRRSVVMSAGPASVIERTCSAY